jgi:hypothetical protein
MALRWLRGLRWRRRSGVVTPARPGAPQVRTIMTWRSGTVTPARSTAPQVRTITTQRLRVTVNSDGFIVERRDGLSGWTASHRLRWSDVKSMDIDTGTFDSSLGLYAAMTTSSTRRHMFDARLLTRQEWATLTNAVAVCSEGKVILDLSGFEKSRPFNEF